MVDARRFPNTNELGDLVVYVYYGSIWMPAHESEEDPPFPSRDIRNVYFVKDKAEMSDFLFLEMSSPGSYQNEGNASHAMFRKPIRHFFVPVEMRFEMFFQRCGKR